MPAPVMPKDKASEIVRHAKLVLVDQGADGFSIRKVAHAAGMSLGHLQHYFPTKSDLLNAMVKSLMKSFYRYFKHEVEPVPNPLDRLVASAEFILDQGPDERMVPLLREFWSMATRDAAIADSLSDFYAQCQRFVAEMLTEASPELDSIEIKHRSCTGNEVEPHFRQKIRFDPFITHVNCFTARQRNPGPVASRPAASTSAAHPGSFPGRAAATRRP